MSKITIFSYPLAFDALIRGSPSEYGHIIYMEILEWCGYPTVKKFEDMFSRLDRIPACERQTDEQTDILQQHSWRYA